MRKASHIDDFRMENFRVFYAAPYFENDLEYEIAWHKKHIKKLWKHVRKPHTFHLQFTEEDHGEHRDRHYKEHVIDSIPFHEEILRNHEKRLKAILNFVPKYKYRKIMDITRKHGGCPKFFAYDKAHHEIFFIAEKPNKEQQHWINLVQYRYKLADVVVIK